MVTWVALLLSNTLERRSIPGSVKAKGGCRKALLSELEVTNGVLQVDNGKNKRLDRNHPNFSPSLDENNPYKKIQRFTTIFCAFITLTV